MGLLDRAFRNILRKSTRTILVSLALCFAIASIISVYTGTEESSENTKEMIAEYQSYIVEMGELTDVQERMIQVSVGRGGGFGGGGFGGGGFRPGGWGDEGGSVEIVNLTQDEIDIISSVDFVETVIPKVSNTVGEVDMEQMREMMREMREQGGWGGGGPGGGPGGERTADEGSRINRDELMATFYDYFVEGVPLNASLNKKYSLLPSNIVEGRQLRDGDVLKVLIRDELKSFFNAGVGDDIKIEGYDFQIVGIYSSDMNRNNVYMDLKDAQKVAEMEDDQYSSLDVYVEDKAVIDMVVLDMQDRLPEGFQVTSYADRNARFSDRMHQAQEREIASLEADNEKVENTGTQIMVISVVSAALIVLFLMFYTVKERTREIGIFKALGFTENAIMAQFIAEGTMIGFIGGVFGIGIGWAGAPYLARLLLPESDVYSSISPGISLIVLGLALAVFLGTAGSMIPAWRASRKPPAEAIREGG